jgi:hypothetical protein
MTLMITIDEARRVLAKAGRNERGVFRAASSQRLFERIDLQLTRLGASCTKLPLKALCLDFRRIFDRFQTAQS